MTTPKNPSRRFMVIGVATSIIALSGSGCCIIPGLPCPNLVGGVIQYITNNIGKVMSALSAAGLSSNPTFQALSGLYNTIKTTAADISSLTSDSSTFVQKLVKLVDDFIDTIDNISALLASLPFVPGTGLFSAIVAFLAPVKKYADAARGGLTGASPQAQALEAQLQVGPPSLKSSIGAYAASMTLDQANVLLTNPS